MSRSPDVAIWLDWCAARDLDSGQANWSNVEAFTAEVPVAPATQTRRLGAIRAHYARLRHELAGAPPPRTATLWPRDADLGRLQDRLWELPAYGHPHAVVGRCDAVVHLLAAEGLTRAQIATATPAAVSLDLLPAINGHELEMTNHGLTCPKCALTRWLRVLSAWWNPADGPYAVERCVEDQPADVRRHDCADPVPDGWQQARWLVCRVSRDGTLLNTRLAPRAVTRALSQAEAARNRSRVIPVESPEAVGVIPLESRSTSCSSSERLSQLREIEALLDRLDQELAAHERPQG